MISVEETPLEGVRVIRTTLFRDARGHFRELWNAARYAEAGISNRFVQDNVSVSKGGVVRGLHYQHPHGQAKLVSVLEGEIWDVAVDVRRDSPTFGEWFGTSLSDRSGEQLLIPAGYAHGFLVTSDHAVVSYKCSELYSPGHERTLLWNDPDIGIEWPVANPILSEKDRAGIPLAEVAGGDLPSYDGGITA